MNLTKALKHKKKLAKKVDDLYLRFVSNNSHKTTKQPNYNPETVFNEWMNAVDELVDLKAKIQIANNPIQHKIFRLAELKGVIARLKNIDTREGEYTEYNSGISVAVEYKAFLNVIRKDELVSKLEDELETLQDEIEAFNAITKI